MSEQSPMELAGKQAKVIGDDSNPGPDPNLLVMNLPAGIHPESVALAANSFLKINDRAKILSQSGYAAITSSGSNGVEIGSGASSGNIASVGNVFLRDNAKVFGAVYTSGEITHQNIWTISDEDKNQLGIDLTPYVTLQMRAEFPPNINENVNLEPDTQNVTLVAGNYNQINVKSRATLTLTTGVYTAHQFSVEPDANIIIDDRAGPVILLVKDNCQFKGMLKSVGYETPNWMIVYAGTNTMFIERPFEGTVFAPRASLVLASTFTGHKGSFFANNIEVHQATPVTHVVSEGASVWKTVCSLFAVDQSGTNDFCDVYEVQPASAENQTLIFEIPKGVNPDHIALGATDSLMVGNNVSIVSDDGFIPVLTTSRGQISMGAGDVLGSIASVGNVTSAGGVSLAGDLLTEGEILTPQNFSVSGQVNDAAQLTPLNTINFNFAFVDETDGDVSLQPGRSKILPCGNYGRLTVESGAKLYLYSGEYSFKSLVLKSGSTVILDGRSGKTFLYVKDEMELNASIEPLGKNVPSALGARKAELFVGYFGSVAIAPAATFAGILAAPNATVELGTGTSELFNGSFFAKNIVVHDNVSIAAVSTEVGDFSDDSPVDAINEVLGGETVALTATDNYLNDGSNCDSVTTNSVVEFDIPLVIGVSMGNAGNHEATLTIGTASGEEIICTYRGGASIAHPVSIVDKAMGLEYAFAGCTGGHQARETLTGNVFELCITGDPESNFGDVTQASTYLDKSCNGTMPPLISRGQAAQMRAAFSWETAPTLPETNSLGDPALFYMNIFVADKEQMEMLDALLIHWDSMPLFADEMERVDNLCGTLDSGELYYNDMHGMWVYAVVPGGLYNKIRDAYFSDDVEEDARILFDAMILRDYEASTPQLQATWFDEIGSLRYQTLADNGFFYLGLPEFPDEAAMDEIMQEEHGKVARRLVSAFRWVRDTARKIGRKVSDGLGTLNRWISGTAKVKIDLNMTNMDPMFPAYPPNSPNVSPSIDEKLQIGWGPDGGRELAPQAMEIRLYQYTPIGGLVSYGDTLNQRGIGNLKVGNLGHGGWLVIDYEHKAARITKGISTDRWLYKSSKLDDIDHNVNLSLDITNDNFLIMAETANGYNYNTNIFGFKPPKATVMRGPNAFILGNQMMAPMLSRTNFLPEVVSTFFPSLPGTDLYIGVLSHVDINIPGSALEISGGKAMGITTHEYGHFTTYSMLLKYGINPARMDMILMSYLGEQLGGVDEDEDTNIISESLADFYASQIMSGTNYFGFYDSQWEIPGKPDKPHKLYFCWKTKCADFNYRNPNNRKEQQRMLVELLHDAMDWNWGRKKAMHASNADAWERRPNSTVLQFSPVLYGSIDDEDVVIGGGGFKTMMKFMAHEGTIGSPLTKAIFKDALVDVVKGYTFDGHWTEYWDADERGYKGRHTWCDACDLFVLHEEQVWKKVDDDNGKRYQAVRWAQCRDIDVIADRIGSPPNADLRMDSDCSVCPDRSRMVSDPDGNNVHCEPCPGANEVAKGNKCHACDWSEKPDGNNCVPCPVGQHFSLATATCESCPGGTGWEPASQQCLPCEIDWVITMDDSWPSCGVKVLKEDPVVFDGELCPNEWWIEVHNFQKFLGAEDGTVMGISALAVTEDPNDEIECIQSHVKKQLFYPTPSGAWTLSGSNSTHNVWYTLDDVAYCKDGNMMPIVTMSDISAGLDTVRIRTVCDVAGAPADCITMLNFIAGCSVE